MGGLIHSIPNSFNKVVYPPAQQINLGNKMKTGKISAQLSSAQLSSAQLSSAHCPRSARYT